LDIIPFFWGGGAHTFCCKRRSRINLSSAVGAGDAAKIFWEQN